MGLATIFALLAFFVAMIALWLTSETVKKVENQNEKFVRSHIATLREEMREIDKALTKTTRMAKSHDEGQATLDKRLNEHTKALDDLRERLALMSTQLEELDRSIPSRYRVRVAKPDPKGGDKPSIQ